MFKKIILALALITNTSVTAKNFVQVGDEYSKVPYKEVFPNSGDENLDSLIESTILINVKVSSGYSRGTGFYIGKHFNKHLFLTNAHVMEKSDCKDARISFLNKDLKVSRAKCEEVLVSLFKKENSDLTLFSIKESELTNFRGHGLEIDFDYMPVPGDMLYQHGFGIKKIRSNRTAQRELIKFSPNIAMDTDCAIASPKGLLVDFVDQKISNSMAIGCDMTSGDSGSAIMNRESGKVVALLWGAGKNPSRRERFSSEEFWNDILGTRDARVWENLAYAVSLKAILPKIKKFLDL